MAQEIERKFLVTNASWREGATGKLYRQGYIATQDKTTVRVRTVGDRGYLTLKGPVVGFTRPEFEYEIPTEDADRMLAELCRPPLIEKRRHRITIGDHLWEVDEFLGENAGLVMAEIELSYEAEAFEKPSWLGEEVSYDARYYNSNLAQHPYRTWSSTVQPDVSA